MANSAESKNISVFRVTIALCLSLYFHNICIYLLIAFFLLSFTYKEALLYLVLLGSALLFFKLISDFVPYGIVEFRNYNYYIVDKLFYKVALYTDRTLSKGDIISCCGFEKCTDISLLKKNIMFTGSDHSLECSFIPRMLIKKQLNNLSEPASAAALKILYNQYIDDESLNFNIGYGLYSYYFLDYLRKKNPACCIIALILISLLFSFEVKFLLLLIDCLFSKKDKTVILTCKILFICIYNFSLIYNYSILLPVLFSFIRMFARRYDFSIYLLLIESLFFKEIDLIETLFFSFLIKIKILFYILSMITILLPYLQNIYLFLIRAYSAICGLSIPIRGSVSLISIALFLFLNRIFTFNRFLQMALLCVLIISPLNQPLMNVCFIDVGQGDSALIRYPFSGNCVLIDTGSKFNYHKLRKTLFSKGIYKIDYLIISHDDEDHNGNIDNLMEDFKIEQIILTGKDFSFGNINYHHLDLGKYEEDNDNSLVYHIKIDDYDFLFTGDLSKKVENRIDEIYGPLKIDFLKVSHHGSYTGTSPYLIGNILPEYAIISTNGKYDHPSDETIETLNSYLVRYFITKNSGNVDIYFSRLLDFIKTGHNDFVIINKK